MPTPEHDPPIVGWVDEEVDRCAACGHARAFHQIGTGRGVPVGKAFCDDRHDEPCDCAGFVRPVDVACAGCELFTRSPLGRTDAGARDLPPPLCTLTAWCMREPGHGGMCTPRPANTYPVADFGPARRRT